MKTLRLLRFLLPLLLVGHCASVKVSAQTPTEKKEAKKEEYHIKLVKIENGQTISVDTTFTSHDDLKKFHEENMKKYMPEGHGDKPFNVKINNNVEKEIIVKDGDTIIKHRMHIEKLGGDTLTDVLKFDIELPVEELEGLPAGHHIKMVKIIAFINLEEPTKDELKNSPNTEMQNAANEKTLAVNSLNVYPNPSTGSVNLDFDLAEKGKTQLLVTDLQGKEIYKEEFVNDGPGMKTRTVDLSKQASGFYLLKIKTGDKSIVRKISIAD